MTPAVRSVILGAPFSPYRLPGIAARYDASILSSITYDGSNLVSNWADLSGQNRPLIQATGSLQPLLVIGARNYVEFDGVDNVMQAVTFTLAQPETVYFVGKQVTWTYLDTFYDGVTGGSMYLLQYPDATSPSIAIAGGGSAVADNAGLAVDTFGIVTAVFSGAASLLRVNRGTATTGSGGTTAAAGFTLGRTGTALDRYGNIQAQEIIIYQGAHDTPTQNKVIAWLGAKWGIAV